MANFPTGAATGSIFSTAQSVYRYAGHNQWEIISPNISLGYPETQESFVDAGSLEHLGTVGASTIGNITASVLHLDGTHVTSVDSYTKLLLLMSGPTGSTGFYDLSGNSHPITVAGHSHISTAQSKFGGSSLYLDGTGDYLDVTDSSGDFDFGTGDFTVEFWIYFTAISSYQDLIGTATNTSMLGAGKDGWVAAYYSGTTDFRFSQQFNNAWTLEAAFDFTAVINTWYHVAYTREGASLKCFVDGVQADATVATSLDLSSTEGYCRIGGGYGNTAGLPNGYMTDIHISKGIARYSGSFTPSRLYAPATPITGSAVKLKVSSSGISGTPPVLKIENKYNNILKEYTINITGSSA